VLICLVVLFSNFSCRKGVYTNRYNVLVNAENFYLSIEGRYRKVGFYTTVFVSCSDSAEAGEIALRSIREDSTLFDSLGNDPDNPPRLNATEIEEIEADSDETVGRTGLAFYDE